MCKCMSCAARQWPTHRDLSKGMLVWVCVYSNKYPIAECERSELAPISRGSKGVRGAETTFQALAQHYLRGVRFKAPVPGRGGG